MVGQGYKKVSNLFVTTKLKDFRDSNGWSRKEFAELLSVQLNEEITESMLNMWERGERSITPNIALEIARIYKLELKELVERR